MCIFILYVYSSHTNTYSIITVNRVWKIDIGEITFLTFIDYRNYVLINVSIDDGFEFPNTKLEFPKCNSL